MCARGEGLHFLFSSQISSLLLPRPLALSDHSYRIFRCGDGYNVHRETVAKGVPIKGERERDLLLYECCTVCITPALYHVCNDALCRPGQLLQRCASLGLVWDVSHSRLFSHLASKTPGSS